jgi:uncharacterized protein YggT (Ycf19 family)
MIIILAFLIFLRILTYLIILDIILSWLSLLWLKLRPQFLSDIIDPIYNSIKKIIPTTIWPFDLTPIIVYLLIFFITGLIFTFFPESQWEFFKILQFS